MSAAERDFDVITVGGGHAGIEAAAAAARMGWRTLLLTHNLDTIGEMSCNPAFGGIGKGHLLREVDALGGVCPQVLDKAGIHFRTLNQSKGPAVRATRAQTDRYLYKQELRRVLFNYPRLSIFQQPCTGVKLKDESVCGVTTAAGIEFSCRALIICAGTFLHGLIHIGLNHYSGGRAGDPASEALATALSDLGLPVGRLKTGTPARLLAESIDFSRLKRQDPDEQQPCFSFLSEPCVHPRQVSCYLTRTNERTHDIIRGGLDRSPLYSGVIHSIGPRYCPSIEDKVVRYPERNSHQIFLEPESLTSPLIYPNGISTSLPFDVQENFLRSIEGLEHVVIARPGYAIEYDFYDPRGIYPTTASRHVKGLFLAGQVNGTTGYEEAAAQGLLAGINAALYLKGSEGWYPRRDEAYLGVMMDDLCTLGTREPYRMFTSRAEYRLRLREDNADRRLTLKGRELGVVDDRRWRFFERKMELLEKSRAWLKKTTVHADDAKALELEELTGEKLSHAASIYELSKRPCCTPEKMCALCENWWSREQKPAEDSAHNANADNYYKDVTAADVANDANDANDADDVDEANEENHVKSGDDPEQKMPLRQALEQALIDSRYEGYLEREQEEIARHMENELTVLPEKFDYAQISSLSREVQQKLNEFKPRTIGMASRLQGVTPAAISILLVHLKKLGLLSRPT